MVTVSRLDIGHKETDSPEAVTVPEDGDIHRRISVKVFRDRTVSQFPEVGAGDPSQGPKSANIPEYPGVTGTVSVIISGDGAIVRPSEIKPGQTADGPESRTGPEYPNPGGAVAVVIPAGRYVPLQPESPGRLLSIHWASCWR